MAKIEKKSIADFINLKPQTRKPSAEEIEKITSEIHEQPPPPTPPRPTEFVEEDVAPVQLPTAEKIKRISVNAPVTLYLKAKTKATLQDQSLMEYIIRLMEADLK